MTIQRNPSPAPSRPTRILLVDDHPLVREGLARALTREADLMICGEAEDCRQALQVISTAKPRLAIVDLALKESYGLELIKDVRARFPEVLMLVVSMQDELLHAEPALRAGASGYITKEEATVHVVQAVRQVLRGELYTSQRVALRIASNVCGRSRSNASSPPAHLSDREAEVFQLIGDGLGRRQIAERLHLDVNTVESYRSRLREKLRLKDAQELLQYAIRSHRAGGSPA